MRAARKLLTRRRRGRDEQTGNEGWRRRGEEQELKFIFLLRSGAKMASAEVTVAMEKRV